MNFIYRYEGEYNRGQYEGFGECWFDGGGHYKGMFSQGMMHGEGVFTWKNGLIYEGELLHNAITGKGMYTWPDGSTYDGEVQNGLRHGFGTFNDKEGKKSYTGEWTHGRRNGKVSSGGDSNKLRSKACLRTELAITLS